VAGAGVQLEEGGLSQEGGVIWPGEGGLLGWFRWRAAAQEGAAWEGGAIQVVGGASLHELDPCFISQGKSFTRKIEYKD
jgi:hypothetical protein